MKAKIFIGLSAILFLNGCVQEELTEKISSTEKTLLEEKIAAAITASNYDNIILSRNPVAFWNTASGSDLTQRGHTGKLLNRPTSTTLPNGDKAFVFNGTNQYVEVTSAPDLSIPTSGILTLEGWLRPDVLDFPKEESTGYVHWMGKGENGKHEYVARMYGQHPTGEDAPRLNRISGYSYNLQGGLGTGSYYQAASSWLIRKGEWIHFVLIVNTNVRSSAYPTGYTKLYVHRKKSDGTIVAFKDQDALINYNIIPQAGNAPFRIGTRNLQSYFKGAVGKVAIYNFELSSTQSLDHAKAMFN